MTKSPTFFELGESRRNNFDFLRFMLACLVIFSHSYPLTGENNLEPLNRLSKGQIDVGKVSVDFFFVISGFLISSSWMHSNNAWDYAKKRALRIYPGFVAALFVCALIVGPMGGADLRHYFHQQDLFQFISRPLSFRNVYPIQGVFLSNAIPGNMDGSLWTIRFGVFCYLLVLVGGLAGVYRRKSFVLLAFALCFIFYKMWHKPLSLGYLDYLDEMPRLILFFLAGMTFFFFRDRILHSPVLLVVSVLAIVISIKKGLGITFPIFGTYLLFYFAFHPSIRLHGFGRHGDFSYGIYLYAFPIQQLVIYYSHQSITPMVVFLIALPITLVVAVASWFGVEKPFLRLKSRARNTNADLGFVSGVQSDKVAYYETAVNVSEKP